MAEIERIYTISLRRGWLGEPRSKRSNRAIRDIRDFVREHTKAKDIKISKGVNELVFSHGFQKPPKSIKVEVKGDLERVEVKLPGEVITRPEEKKKGIAGLKEKLTGKKEEKKAKEEKTEDVEAEGKEKETRSGEKKGPGKPEVKKESGNKRKK